MDLSGITLPSPTGSPLSFAQYKGGRAILLLGNQKTSDAVPALVNQLQADPRTADVPILQVAHLVGVPKVLRRMAERDVRKTLAAQHSELTGKRGLGKEEAGRLVALGLDWEGEVTKHFGFTSADDQPVAAVLDETSSVIVSTRGPEAVPELTEVFGA